MNVLTAGHKVCLHIFLLLIPVVFFSQKASGQDNDKIADLRELLRLAENNYPLLKSKAEEVNAAGEGLANARTTRLPSADLSYQVNYATYNNITGMADGRYFVPISGPPSADNGYDGVFGSAGGLLLNWNVFDFGERGAAIDFSKSNLEYSRADLVNEIFQHKTRVINAYLDVIMAHEFMKVYTENLDRTVENLKMIRALVNNGLRPATDTALFISDYSEARIRLLDYEGILQSRESVLAGLVGQQTVSCTMDSNYFNLLPRDPEKDTSLAGNPVIKLSQEGLALSNSKLKMISRSALPGLSLWSTFYARGSGIRYDGFVSSSDGLAFSRYNYGIGLVLSFPMVKWISVHYLSEQQKSLVNAENEKLNQARLDLSNDLRVASVLFDNKLKIARESPAFYNSAKFSYEAIESRYQSGLANYPDLIQARYALIKADTEMKKSYLDSWKALLYRAAIEGDLSEFLNQVK